MDQREPISVRVVETVAAYHDVDPIALEPPLHAVVDPDALESLFAGRDHGGRSIGTVEFEYCGCTVTVDSSGGVEVTNADRRSGGADEPISRTRHR